MTIALRNLSLKRRSRWSQITDVCHSASIFKADTDLVSNEDLAEGMIGVTVFALKLIQS
jgi:hypothetical protein